MKAPNKIKRYKRNTTLWAVCLISLVHIGVNFISSTHLFVAIISWMVSTLGAILLIHFAFLQIKRLQVDLQDQILGHQRFSQLQTALAKLSTGFATALSEDEICWELVQRLNEIHGYEHVAIFLIDKINGNRNLKAKIGGLGLPDEASIPPEQGLSGQPLLDGQLQYTPDVSKSKRYMPGLGQGSEVDVPIIFGNEIFGVIVIESNQTNAFGPDDFKMINAVADQAALAISNTRSLSSEKQRRLEADILRKATNAVNSDLELDIVLDRILNQLDRVVPFDCATIFLWEDDFLYAKAALGLPVPDEVIGHKYPADDELFQEVLSTKKPLIIENIQEAKNFQGWGGTQDMSSWLGLPLLVRNEIIGILTLDNKEIGAYDLEKTELAMVFAGQAAVALHNAQLYQAAKNSADQLMILHQASQKIIGASFDPERTYATIHEATKQLMPCEAFSIAILDESKDEIEAVYLYDREGRSPPVRIPSNQGLSGYIISTGKALHIHDYLESEIMKEIPVRHFGHPDHIRAFLAVPLVLGTKVVGMLSAQCYLPHKYTSQDRLMLEMLAAHAAIAIDNAHLFSQVQHLAITDSLTGVFNRRYFFDSAQREFSRALRYGHPLSLLMLDLDNYKKINDLHGHLFGDIALQKISQIIQINIRETDILGRYGGDEFSILLPETSTDQALEIADRLRLVIAEADFEIENKMIKTTISIGVSSTNKQVSDFSQLLLSADLALYDAKNEGRNTIYFHSWPFRESNDGIQPSREHNISTG